jgi:Winged helix DNA-binding domain
VGRAKDDVIRRRLHNQRLAGSEFETPEQVVAWLGAVQAQDYPGAKWGVALRSHTLTESDLDAAFDEGRILRTHILRPTWHFIAAPDIRWMLELSAPRVHVSNAHMYRKLELDDRAFARSRSIIRRALKGGRSSTRTELAAALTKGGIEASGQRLAYIVMHEELDGILTSGPRRGKQFTYMLLDERAPNAQRLAPDAALAGLTRRYFAGHGPATIRDLVWWSGLTVRQARSGIEMLGPQVGDLTYWTVPSKAPASADPARLYLLPNYDEYLIAYRDRGNVAGLLTTADAPHDFDIYAHVLVLDGRFGGTWRRAQSSGTVEITVRPVDRLGREHARALTAAAGRHGEFLGVKATVCPMS